MKRTLLVIAMGFVCSSAANAEMDIQTNGVTLYIWTVDMGPERLPDIDDAYYDYGGDFHVPVVTIPFNLRACGLELAYVQKVAPGFVHVAPTGRGKTFLVTDCEIWVGDVGRSVYRTLNWNAKN